MNTENFLIETYKILQNYDGEKQSGYNIFKVLEITDKEVLICRVLADFLNPNGLHNKGDKYLRIFLKEILCRNDYNDICKNARVVKEYPIDADRRIDIVIWSDDDFIPIEVKIHAGEQKAQCYDYYAFAKNKSKCHKVIYLTKFGTAPSKYSLTSDAGDISISEDEVYCISFSEDIRHYMDIILNNETDTAIIEIARQYKEAIEDFTSIVGDELRKRVSEMALSSEESFRSMLIIEQSANKAKAGLMYSLMEEIEQQMSVLCTKYNISKERQFCYYEYPEQATEEFYRCYSTYPGINYVVRDISLFDGIELWVRIEIDHNLYAGICLFDTKANSELKKPDDKIIELLKEHIDIKDAHLDNWWIKWWYLPTATDKKVNIQLVPNFKDMNEAAIRLSNGDTRKKFIEEVINVMDRQLGKLFGK